MRAVIQRVSQATVKIEAEAVGQVGRGLLVLVGISPADTPADSLWLARKITAMRIFSDENGKMNHDVRQAGGGILLVSQFTLYADTRKGNRPGFSQAAPPEIAVPLYETFIRHLSEALEKPVQTGRFGADMQVSLINDGPVTIILDTAEAVRG